MSSVRAAVMTAPGKIEIREVAWPTVPDDCFLMKVDELGLCGSDKHMYLGHMQVPFPVVFGHEAVGHIAKLGSKANDSMNIIGGPLQEGDAVIIVPSSDACHHCTMCLHAPDRPYLCPNREVHGFLNLSGPEDLRGGSAEYMIIRPRSWVFKAPADLPAERRVLAEPAAVATRAVEKALMPGLPTSGSGLGIGKSVVVQGVGPIGLLIVAVLRYAGAGQIIATDSVNSRLEMASKLGATELLNITSSNVAQRMERVRALTEGLGADVVIEAAGVPAAFAESLQLVRRGGIVIEIGHYTDSGAVEIHPWTICNKDLDVRGVWAYPQMQFEPALRFLAGCTLPLESIISHRIPLDDVAHGLDLMGTEGVLKVVVTP